ncbi:GntR family transcriptional regulator [Roseomonas sp. CCTCC AB2023176]|uniref:GntR family transcriptional regulator n=1 Tax=Roseomonas sp. CCTCC AB2023176 TaxID=3342640 RepID=UPI0035DB0EDE
MRRPDPRPLYQQVETILRERIVGRTWSPGHLLPSEPELAEELGVSPGTVRRALAALERAHLIERRQGRGTFVANQTSEQALDQFFRVRDLHGQHVVPETVIHAVEAAEATAAEAKALSVPRGAPVHRIRRSRRLGGVAAVVETITLPAALFPGLDLPLAPARLGMEIYVHYRRAHGIIVTSAQEEIAARGATAAEADALGVPVGTPVLEVVRTARDGTDRPVERRVTVLHTAAHRYAVDLE